MPGPFDPFSIYAKPGTGGGGFGSGFNQVGTLPGAPAAGGGFALPAGDQTGGLTEDRSDPLAGLSGQARTDAYYRLLDPSYGSAPRYDPMAFAGTTGNAPQGSLFMGKYPGGFASGNAQVLGAQYGGPPVGSGSTGPTLLSQAQQQGPGGGGGAAQRLNQQNNVAGAGGFLLSPEDVDYYLAQGQITPEQAETLRQVAQLQGSTGSTGFRATSGDGSGSGGGAGGGAGGGSVVGPNSGISGVSTGSRLPSNVGGSSQFGVPSLFNPTTFGGGVSGSQAPNYGQPNLPAPFNSLPIAQQLTGPFNQLVPGFQNLIPPGYAGFLPDERSNLFNLTAGIFGNDPAGLGGAAGPNLIGTAANLTQGAAISQEQRNALAQQLLGNAVGQLQQGPAAQGTQQVLQGLQQNPFTTSGDQLQQEIEGLIQRRYANAQQGALSNVQQGQAAKGTLGGESALLRAGSDFGTRAALADALAESRINQALRRQQDISTAIQGFGQGGETLQSQILTPQVLQSQALGTQNNPYFNSLVQQIRDLGGLALEDEMREAYTSFGDLIPTINMGINATAAAGSLIGGAGGLAAFSDRAVKRDIRYTGETVRGIPVARFRYLNDDTEYVGVIAQDVERVRPDCVGSIHGVKIVDYAGLGFRMRRI